MSRSRSGNARGWFRNAGLIGIVTAAAVGLAVWRASNEAPRYRSSVRVEIAAGEAATALAGLEALGPTVDRRGLEVVRDPSGRALEVRFESADPETARRGARAAAEAVRSAALAEAAPRDAAATLSAREAEVLDVASRALAAWAELERVRNIDRRTQLEAELRIWEELLAGIARARSADPAAELRGVAARRVPDPAVESIRSRWAAYRSQRAALLSGPAALAANHPDVQRLSTLIASTELTLEGVVRGRIASLSTGIDPSGPEAGVPADAPPADSLQILATLAALERRAAELQDEIAVLRTGGSPSTPPPLEAGEPERLPTNPRREILLGLVVGLLLGGAAALARARVRKGRAPTGVPATPRPAPVATPQAAPAPAPCEASAPDEVPLLAVIPEVVPTLVEPLGSGDFRPGPGQVAGLAAYRELRNRLVGSRWGLKTLVVTSAHPREGKTTTSTNLAATYARQGLKVVLIECDLRRPSLGRYFRITKQIDLMDVLFENRDWRLALQLTRTPGLYVLLGEKSFPRAGDSLGGPEMKRLLAEITAEYDLVILDSSPLLVAADAIVLGPIVDGVLLVVRATRTDRPTVDSVIARLRQAGATVVGTVLNDPDGAAAAWLSSASPGPPDGHRESETPVPPSEPS